MRPRKVVLVVDTEIALSVRTFLLETRGYRVIGTSDPGEAVQLVRSHAFEGAVVSLEVSETLVAELKRIRPNLGVVLVSTLRGMGEVTHCADFFLGKRYNSPADVLDRLKIVTARKRGPKPAVKSAVSLEMVG